ncbi:Bacterial extracellular solute-binding protein [compost metagenome]
MRIKLAVLMLCSLFLTACSNGIIQPYSVQPDKVSNQLTIPEQQDVKQDELTVWSYYDTTSTNQFFESLHPGVKVTTKLFNYNEIVEVYIKAFLNGEGPDIVVFDGNHISNFNGINGLADLSAQQFNSKDYLDKIPDKYIHLYSSFDRKGIIAIPTEIYSAFTFYRADLLEENGFPFEPDELAEYLKDPDHWIYMAKELKKKDIYIFQYYTDPFEVSSMSYSMFDRNLKFNRSGEVYEKTLYTAKEIRRSGLSLRSSMWDSSGQAALRNGQLAMIYMGSWGVNNLKSWVPEQEGKWRAAELPLGLSGFQSGAAAGIVNTSKNKAFAWEYLKLMSNIKEPTADSSSVRYLGGQDILALVNKSVNKPSYLFPTPLDAELADVWSTRIRLMIESDGSDVEDLRQAREYIELLTKSDRKQLMKFIEH